MKHPKQKRRKKLIKPGLQLRLIAAFGSVAALAMLLQFLLLGSLVMRAASTIDGELAARVPGILITVLLTTLLVLMPIFVAVGVLLTFRYAGPVYRFEQFLGSVARGEQSSPCRIRKGDELQSLCDAINVATAPLLRSEEAPVEATEAETDAPGRLAA